MPHVLGSPPSPRAAIFWNGTAWQWALVDAAGHLQIDVLSTAMDPLAATEATLATLATEAKLEAVRVLLASLDGKDYATQVTLAALLTELQAKADLTETQPVSAASLPLPTGAATEATLASADAYLGLIAVLWNCLRTVGTDRFMVKGEDQLFSFKSILGSYRQTSIASADGHGDSAVVPAGEIWVVTHILAMDVTTPTTRHLYSLEHDAASLFFHRIEQAFAAAVGSEVVSKISMGVGDWIRVNYKGSLLNDISRIYLFGHIMTKET